MRTFAVSLLFFVSFSLYATARSESGGLAERVAELEAQVEELSAILEYVYVDTEEINGLTGPHVIFEGANVHVRSGQGMTGFPICPGTCPVLKRGLGNLVVGYNELHPSPTRARTGMHNLIVGQEHQYTSTGGFVAGRRNFIQHLNPSILGGTDNEVIGFWSTVGGGRGNLAGGDWSSVGGGENREAPDRSSWAAGRLYEEN